MKILRKTLGYILVAPIIAIFLCATIPLALFGAIGLIPFILGSALIHDEYSDFKHFIKFLISVAIAPLSLLTTNKETLL